MEFKALLPLAIECLGTGKLPKRHPNHKIGEYWDELAPLLRMLGDYGGDEESVDVVDEAIRQFAHYDPDSFTFRYPTDRNGNPTMANLPRAVSLRVLHDAMWAVADYLDTVHAVLWDDLSYRVSRGKQPPDGFYDMEGPSPFEE